MHNDSDFTDPPPRRLAGLALIRNERGAVLLVEKTYKTGRERFGLVGGSAQPGEPAAIACQRETREETGLLLVPGQVLTIHHMPANGDAREGLNIVFDCGTINAATRLTRPAAEIADFRWTEPEELDDLLAPYQAWRIRAALTALTSGRTNYLSGHPIAQETNR
ncbi:NUDIX hydrolase [Streptomyces carpaticus]|uniref:NUDIX domain-containing protein n=1 Tax=Streptomyces carpaticus TaxID=285558 RepID=UPI0021FE9B87|nr:NUDIX hydrolase [Streptomyces carpaticus]